MDPANIFMLVCMGIIVSLAFINCIYRSQICYCFNKYFDKCFKYNNYNVVELENVIDDNPDDNSKN